MNRYKHTLAAALAAFGILAGSVSAHAAFSNSRLVMLSASPGTTPRLWSYVSTGETIATISAANYFAADPQRLTAGDIVIVQGSDGHASFTVTSASTSANVLARYTGVKTLQAASTWDPSATVDGAGVTSSAITVTGAALGDFCDVAAPYDLAGQIATCYVDSANSVKIRLQNESGTNTDNVEGSWKVRVAK